jgi:hypothetical protein
VSGFTPILLDIFVESVGQNLGMYGCFLDTRALECLVDDVIVLNAKDRKFQRTGACAYFSSVGFLRVLALAVKNYQGRENSLPWQLSESLVGRGVADRFQALPTRSRTPITSM